MDLETRVKAYRFVAYSAVTFSVVAVLSVCVTLPMVYNYVHHVKRTMHNEINFCKGSAKDIWTEVHNLKSLPLPNNRTARQAGYGDAAVTGGAQQVGSCEACCLQDLLVQQVHRESLVDPANQVLQVYPEIPADRHSSHVSQLLLLHVSLVLKDHPDHRVLLGYQEMLDHQDNPDFLVKMRRQENLDQGSARPKWKSWTSWSTWRAWNSCSIRTTRSRRAWPTRRARTTRSSRPSWTTWK
uniref:Col_cuticle_N domain-containing protein n=1 Tax=Haemonchus contortus TaxID=6289 RepID=A0A7I4YMQ2_HAECO